MRNLLVKYVINAVGKIWFLFFSEPDPSAHDAKIPVEDLPRFVFKMNTFLFYFGECQFHPTRTSKDFVKYVKRIMSVFLSVIANTITNGFRAKSVEIISGKLRVHC